MRRVRIVRSEGEGQSGAGPTGSGAAGSGPAGGVPGGSGEMASDVSGGGVSGGAGTGSAEEASGGAAVSGRLHRTGARHQRAGGHRFWWIVPAAVVAAVVAAGVVVALSWPKLTVLRSRAALARVEQTGAAGSLEATFTLGSKTVPLRVEGDRLFPVHPVVAGVTGTVTVQASVPGWLGWLAGHVRRAELRVSTPVVRLENAVSVITPGSRPIARFSRPVAAVAWVTASGRVERTLPSPSAAVPIGATATAGSIGRVKVEAAAEPWERLSAPATLTYFATSGVRAVLAANPAPSTTLPALSSPISLSFAEPVAKVWGSKLPTVTIAVTDTAVPGHWVRDGASELTFEPAADALWPNQTVVVHFPSPIEVGAFSATPSATSSNLTSDVTSSGRLATRSSIDFSTPSGSTLALQEMLASLDYLPVSWSPSAGTSPWTSMAAARRAAVDAPAGTFSWRWTMPQRLESLWSAGSYTVVTRGALMAFEHVNGLNYSPARSNPLLWPTLVKAVVDHRVDPHPYVWIDVSKTLPEHIDLWSNGKIVIQSLANTGIPQTPTQDGTFPVYLRYKVHYMNGFNPNGTPYHDLVHWIAYFNGGDAVHGFYRPDGYGFPQSLGCVELPVEGTDPVAEQVWGYDHIGTLVTVHN